jgi:hypothetical protein
MPWKVCGCRAFAVDVHVGVVHVGVPIHLCEQVRVLSRGRRRCAMGAVAYERIGAGRVCTLDETVAARRYVRSLWMRATYTSGTLAETYFRRRAWLVRCSCLRFLARCPHPDGEPMPAVLALVLDARDNIVAVHRTFIDNDGRKVINRTVKAMVGSSSGGAVPHPPGLLFKPRVLRARTWGLLWEPKI